MPLANLTASVGLTVSVQAAAAKQTTNVPGAAINTSYPATPAIVGTAKANTAKGGADEAAIWLVNLAAAGTATVDLRALIDVLGASVALARVKVIMFRLLSATDDPIKAPVPNATDITVGGTGANDWVSQAGGGGPGSATWSWDIPSGGRLLFDVGAVSAGGSAVDTTHHLLKVTNNDPTNPAVVEITALGGST